jgi:hypothetical protein
MARKSRQRDQMGCCGMPLPPRTAWRAALQTDSINDAPVYETIRRAILERRDESAAAGNHSKSPPSSALVRGSSVRFGLETQDLGLRGDRG